MQGLVTVVLERTLQLQTLMPRQTELTRGIHHLISELLAGYLRKIS